MGYLVVGIWVFCGVVNYIWLRHEFRKEGPWTAQDRKECIGVGVFGPVALLFSLWLFWDDNDDSRPAKW